MVKRVTIKDVAREAGVSIALVSFVMNRNNRRADGKEVYRVSEDTVTRILAIAERLDYHPNSAASTLRSGKTRTIGVIVSDISNRFFSDIVRRIENVAYKSGYTVIFASTDEKVDKMEHMVSVLINKGIDGLIIASCAGGEDIVRHIVEAGMPVVLLDRDIDDVGASRVLLDNVEACRIGVNKLYNQGYRRIEMVSYDLAVSTIRNREVGYTDEMCRLGLRDFVGIHRVEYGKCCDGVMQIVDDARSRGVEALIFPTNTLSIMALQAVNSLGLHLPDDMAMVCFDDNEIFDLYQPTLARIGQPVDVLGDKSFEFLCNMIERNSSPECFIVEPQFIDGDSARMKVKNSVN